MKDDVPMIEEYRVESMMLHETRKSRFMMIVAILCCIVAITAIIGNVWIVEIFTTKYNSRTSEWLETVKVLVNNQAGAEVQYAEAMEQFTPP